MYENLCVPYPQRCSATALAAATSTCQHRALAIQRHHIKSYPLAFLPHLLCIEPCMRGDSHPADMCPLRHSSIPPLPGGDPPGGPLQATSGGCCSITLRMSVVLPHAGAPVRNKWRLNVCAIGGGEALQPGPPVRILEPGRDGPVQQNVRERPHGSRPQDLETPRCSRDLSLFGQRFPHQSTKPTAVAGELVSELSQMQLTITTLDDRVIAVDVSSPC